MASSDPHKGEGRPILKMPVLAPSRLHAGIGSSATVTTAAGSSFAAKSTTSQSSHAGDSASGRAVASSASVSSRTSSYSFPGLSKSKLSDLPILSKDKPVAATPESSTSSSEAASGATAATGFIPLTSVSEPSSNPLSLMSATSPEKKDAKEPERQKEKENEEKEGERAKEKDVSEKQFVFGENLMERAKNFEENSGDRDKPETSKTADKKTGPGSEEPKTLSESAAQYCQTHNQQKRKYEEVKLVTGEEDEVNVLQIHSKLHVFEKNTSNWLERGRGTLRLNDLKDTGQCEGEDGDGDGEAARNANHSVNSRIVMRTTGSLRVILNTPIFSNMSVEKATEKSIRMTGMDEGNVKIFLVTASSKDIAELYRALKARLERAQDCEPPKKKSHAP